MAHILELQGLSVADKGGSCTCISLMSSQVSN